MARELPGGEKLDDRCVEAHRDGVFGREHRAGQALGLLPPLAGAIEVPRPRHPHVRVERAAVVEVDRAGSCRAPRPTRRCGPDRSAPSSRGSGDAKDAICFPCSAPESARGAEDRVALRHRLDLDRDRAREGALEVAAAARREARGRRGSGREGEPSGRLAVHRRDEQSAAPPAVDEARQRARERRGGALRSGLLAREGTSQSVSVGAGSQATRRAVGRTTCAPAARCGRAPSPLGPRRARRRTGSPGSVAARTSGARLVVRGSRAARAGARRRPAARTASRRGPRRSSRAGRGRPPPSP